MAALAAEVHPQTETRVPKTAIQYSTNALLILRRLTPMIVMKFGGTLGGRTAKAIERSAGIRQGPPGTTKPAVGGQRHGKGWTDQLLAMARAAGRPV